MSRFKLLYFVIFIIHLHRLNAQISDKRLCVDAECKVPISQAKTLLRYSSPDPRILSFAPNIDITIYSKEAGSRVDLWGAEIGGKRGYVPKHMVRETKVLEKPTLLVNTEDQVPIPDKVQEPYEVVDGTTLYLTPKEGINPSSTEALVQPTALPESNKKIEENESEEDEEDVGIEDDEEETDDTEEETEPRVASEGNLSSTETQVETVKDSEEPKENIVKSTVEESSSEIKIPEALPLSEAPKSLETAPSTEQALETPPATITPETPISSPSELVPEKTSNQAPEETLKETPKIISEETLKEASKIIAEETLKEALKNISEETSKDASSEPSKIEEEHTTEPEEQHSNQENNALNQDSSIKEITNLEENEGANLDNVINEEINHSFGETETVSQDSSIKVETNQSSEQTLAHIETTTLSPEPDVPPPFEDSYVEVTQNPLDEKKIEKNPTILPPFGLFQQSLSSREEATEENQNIAEDVHEDQKYDDVKIEETSKESIDEPIIQEKEKVKSEEIEEVKLEEIEEVKSEEIEEVKSEEIDETTRDTEFTTPKEEITEDQNDEIAESPGFLAGFMSFFTGSEDIKNEEFTDYVPEVPQAIGEELLSSKDTETQQCEVSTGMDFLSFNSDVFLYLVTTAISVIVFLFGYILLDKSKREGPLIAKINKLEKELLVIVKENQILQEKSAGTGAQNDLVSNEIMESLKQELLDLSAVKSGLEDQVQSLEKELENSTEVGMELNRMLSEILSSESASEVLQTNVEHLQRQLIEQQSTINSVNETLAVTNTENHELRLELDIANKKVLDLQSELDKLLLNILKIEEEKDAQQSTLEAEISKLRRNLEELNTNLKLREESHSNELKQLKTRLEQAERKLELKTKEHEVITDTVKQLKAVKNKDDLQGILEVGGVKAELQVLKSENQRFVERIQQEEGARVSCEKKSQLVESELRQLKDKYDEADKLRAEAQTKLEVLSNYFKDREAQWQKEISKHEALWAEKQGEATSTTERIKFMQEQLQNYKAQTESLKQEIMNQEIELKSQISVLEKKAHENWVSARQAERKAEDAKQEAAQLRHRLTLRERAIQDDKNRLQSPIEQNGEMPNSPASPPLLYTGRDHLTKSPPIPGLPPFLPPPPGVPFMPPPLPGVSPFIPPPPNMFPEDHRPPPLGRMSSPPLNSRYSPNSRWYPYDRNSSSPSDSEYGTSPPHRRGYSPFNNRGEERREYKRPPPGRSNGRSLIKGGSSGSGHSNESIEKINWQQSTV